MEHKITSALCSAVCIAVTAICFAADVPTLSPQVVGYKSDTSNKLDDKYTAAVTKFAAYYDSIAAKAEKGAKLSAQEESIVGEFGGPDWNNKFSKYGTAGCSWYCGGYPFKIDASSTLAPQGKYTYDANNAFDSNISTAWVEGAKDDGIKESLTFYFDENCPPLTKVCIHNGFAFNDAVWQQNNRVKEITLKINGMDFAVLNLKDTWKPQWFTLPHPVCFRDAKTFGTDVANVGKQTAVTNRKNLKTGTFEGQSHTYWTLTFEIKSVYRGTKYRDTAIAGVDFDGTGVHCIAEGGLVLMADGSQRAVETLQAGDMVAAPKLDTDGSTYTLAASTVKAVHKLMHDNVVMLSTADGHSVAVTDDHPVMFESGWQCASGHSSYEALPCGIYSEGSSILIFKNGSIARTELLEVQALKELMATFLIVLEDGNSMIVNGFIVGAEDSKIYPTK